MPTALLSVSDKTGLLDFATSLSKLGWDLISTGGTAKALRAAGVNVRDVSDVTHFPEMLDGRVKTLHPAIHGGLLARRDSPEHMKALAEHKIAPIDLVAVSLYPFEQTAARAGAKAEEVIEQIDIGGPSMLRSAAKNFASVTVIVDPADYGRVLASLEAKDDDLDLRRVLAEKVFERTAAYDAAIARWFARERSETFPDSIAIPLERETTLRYGENPGQRAAFYVERHKDGIAALEKKGGKELSFNNLLDLEGALFATDPFQGETCCAIVKHTTPCGLATGATALDAYKKALECDPLSAFGSVISFTVPVDDETAEAISSLFVECIVAPKFSEGALEILGRKKESPGAGRSGALARRGARLQADSRRVSRAGAHRTRRRERGLESGDQASADGDRAQGSSVRLARGRERQVKRDRPRARRRDDRHRRRTDVARRRGLFFPCTRRVSPATIPRAR